MIENSSNKNSFTAACWACSYTSEWILKDKFFLSTDDILIDFEKI